MNAPTRAMNMLSNGMASILPVGRKGCCGYRSIIVHSSDAMMRNTPTTPKTIVLCAKKSISISTRTIPRTKSATTSQPASPAR